MKIYNNDKKIYIECDIDEAYSPEFETRYQRTLKELDTIKNTSGHYKGRVTSSYYNITRDISKAKEICNIITCSSKEELLETLNAKDITDRKMEIAAAKISRVSRNIGEKLGIKDPIYQLEFSADHYCDEDTFKQIKKIRPISRYKVENGKVVAELRQKMDLVTAGNEYSAHIQLANALSREFSLPVKLRSEIKGNYATEIITDERENITRLHLSGESREDTTFAQMNRELEKWNRCQSKMGTSLDIVMGSPSNKITQETNERRTSVKISDVVGSHIAFSYKIPNSNILDREIIVKYKGDIRSIAGEIEKNCRATISYVTKTDFTAPLKIIFREEHEMKDPEKRREIKPAKEKRKEYTPKIQQRLI